MGSNEGLHTVVLVRHGESEWNNDNRFCGWVDVGLSPLGYEEATTAAEAISASGIDISLVYTSLLKRANITMEKIMEVSSLSLSRDQVIKDWRLNERHYGALTGLNKADCVNKFGADQVQVWRRSFDVPPATMDDNHPYYKAIANQPAFAGILSPDQIPKTESLKDLINRTIPFWTTEVEPNILAGKTVLCVAHGTSLRGIVKHIEGISDEAICKINLPNGIPFVYHLDKDLKPVGEREYLADKETVKKAVAKVANIVPGQN
eukprot:GFUD01031944.1.p1 GENE.GFUD01031944.1~~GFUD01031944.1.p1  ORF type:complete len:262 (+),score=73.97 GFUD01031944.1:165-950(+)